MCNVTNVSYLNNATSKLTSCSVSPTISLHALQNQQNNSQEVTFEIRILCTLDLFSFSSRLFFYSAQRLHIRHDKTTGGWATKSARLHPCNCFHEFFIWCLGQQSTGGNEAKQQRSVNTSHSISIATQNKEHKEMLPLQTSTQQTQTERHSYRGRLEELSVSQSKVLFKVCGRVNWMTAAAISIMSTNSTTLSHFIS